LIGLGHKDVAMALAADPLQGGLWLGFFQGGVAYWKDGQVRASYTAASGLGKGAVSHLRVDADGALWAATEGGLSRLKDGRAATLSSKNGLPCDEVNWVIEDNDHSLWLYMACGLVRISASEARAWEGDPNRSIQVTVFDSSDGVRSRAAVPTASPQASKSPDGKIWFTTGEGVSVIDPHHLPVNKVPPPVQVEQIRADGKSYETSRELPPLVRDLTIDYTALSFVVPEKVLFRYKLEGWDRDWQNAGNRRQAFYTNLPPRNYRFRVIASNNSGVWNEAGAMFDFSVAPAYYQTNWFRASCVAIFLATIWAIYWLRVRVLEERHRILEQHRSEISALNERLMRVQEEERMRIAGELHDGVLQQITSLTLRLGTATLKLPPDSDAKARIRESQKELIKVGTDLRHLSHELHPVLLQETGLPAALSAYCEEFSMVRGIPVSCEADESVNELAPGSALCLFRIAQEALGNIAKHARARQVKLQLRRSNGNVCLSVSDDGVGFSRDEKTGGLGLVNMRERVHQLNGTFEFDSEPGRGTRVRATVPF
jgi:signal transduction histidine kinase